MSHSIRVIALASVMGMVRGQQYTLEANSTVDALIDHGFVKWLDVPVAEPVAEITPEVKKRAAKPKPVEELAPEEAADELVAQAQLEDDGAPLSEWSESKRKLDVQSGPEFYDGE